MKNKGTQRAFGIFKDLDCVDSQLDVISTDEKDKFIRKSENELNIKRSYEATYNFIVLPAFWMKKPIELFPIIESKIVNESTPDYLAIYNENKVLIECKTSNFNGIDSKKLQKRIERRISKAKKQLKSHPELPGICILQTNKKEIFSDQEMLRAFIQTKVDDEKSNLSAIIFTYYIEDIKKGKAYFDFTVFLNFRSTILLPQGFYQDILENRGSINISAIRGDRFSLSKIERVCSHYGFNPNLDQLEELINSRNKINNIQRI